MVRLSELVLDLLADEHGVSRANIDLTVDQRNASPDSALSVPIVP